MLHLFWLLLPAVAQEPVADAPEAPAPVTNKPEGAWQIEVVHNPDGRFAYTASLAANSEVAGWPDKTATPELVLTCRGRKVTASVRTVLRPDSAGDITDEFLAWGAVKLDSAEWERVQMRRNEDNDALVFPKAKYWLTRFRSTNTLHFGFTPFASPSVETSFSLKGYDAVIEPLQRSCGKKQQHINYDL